jgi:hypothetical protein
VHANDHVNCSQSSNVVIPTAIHVIASIYRGTVARSDQAVLAGRLFTLVTGLLPNQLFQGGEQVEK